MSKGYFLLHRKITEWEWFDDPKSVSLWIYILAKTNFEESVYRGQTIKRGQAVFGRKKAAEQTGLTEKEVRTRLKRFEDSGQIYVKRASKRASNFSIISVYNYEQYQDFTYGKGPVKGHAKGHIKRINEKQPRAHTREENQKPNCTQCQYYRGGECNNLNKPGYPDNCKSFRSIADLVDLKRIR
jgi:hypothetical protein